MCHVPSCPAEPLAAKIETMQKVSIETTVVIDDIKFALKGSIPIAPSGMTCQTTNALSGIIADVDELCGILKLNLSELYGIKDLLR